MPPPAPATVPLLRITPEIVSILDYSKGFGHADLVRVSDDDLEDFVEARGIIGRASTRPDVLHSSCAPRGIDAPRTNSSALIGCLPER